MIEISIIVYFGINIFLAGYHLGDDGRFNSWYRNLISVFFLIFFAVFVVFGYYLVNFLRYVLEPVYRETRFLYLFYLTKHFDKIYLDDNYSDVFKTREEKLKRTEEVSKTKQMKRHNKFIQNKYKTL